MAHQCISSAVILTWFFSLSVTNKRVAGVVHELYLVQLMHVLWLFCIHSSCDKVDLNNTFPFEKCKKTLHLFSFLSKEAQHIVYSPMAQPHLMPLRCPLMVCFPVPFLIIPKLHFPVSVLQHMELMCSVSFSTTVFSSLGCL